MEAHNVSHGMWLVCPGKLPMLVVVVQRITIHLDMEKVDKHGQY